MDNAVSSPPSVPPPGVRCRSQYLDTGAVTGRAATGDTKFDDTPVSELPVANSCAVEGDRKGQRSERTK
jgi:hypothetical protein